MTMYDHYLITGATGFLGKTLTERLIKSGARVTALVLADDPLRAELPAAVEPIFGDVTDKASLQAFFDTIQEPRRTCLIHCAGMISVATRPPKELYQVNIRGTKNITDFCLACHIAKLVYVCSVHALTERPRGEVITEAAGYAMRRANGPYAKSKSFAAGFVLDAARRGLPASIVLPSGMIGPGDTAGGAITRLLLAFRCHRLPAAVRGGYDFVDVRDVAEGILACAERGTSGESYILSGHYATIREILTLARHDTDYRLPRIFLSPRSAMRLAPLFEKMSLAKGQKPFFTPYSVKVLASNGFFSHQKAAEAFGYAPRSLAASLRDTMAWLDSNEDDKRQTRA